MLTHKLSFGNNLSINGDSDMADKNHFDKGFEQLEHLMVAAMLGEPSQIVNLMKIQKNLERCADELKTASDLFNDKIASLYRIDYDEEAFEKVRDESHVLLDNLIDKIGIMSKTISDIK